MLTVNLGAVHKCQHFHECTNHTLSGAGSVKINIFCVHLTFWPDFYYFNGDFWHSKNVDVCSLFLEGGEGVSESMVCSHENVDIYGQPLKPVHKHSG